MTPTERAARWLADVPRYRIMVDGDLQENEQYGDLYQVDDVLSAIARHLAPGDDLKLIADCELAAKVMADAGTFETGQSILREAAARILALTATVAELQAALSKIDVGEGWAALIARAALEDAGRK